MGSADRGDRPAEWTNGLVLRVAEAVEEAVLLRIPDKVQRPAGVEVRHLGPLRSDRHR